MALVKLLQRSITCHTSFRQILPLSCFIQIQQEVRCRRRGNCYYHHYHHHNHHQQQDNNNNNNNNVYHLPHWLFIATGTIATLGKELVPFISC